MERERPETELPDEGFDYEPAVDATLEPDAYDQPDVGDQDAAE